MLSHIQGVLEAIMYLVSPKFRQIHSILHHFRDKFENLNDLNVAYKSLSYGTEC